MSLKIGNKTPVAMMVGDRHIKKASMFVHKSSTAYNIDLSKINYVLVDQAVMEYLDNSAIPGTIDVSFVRSSFNKSNRSITFSNITVRYLANYHGYPGGTILTMMLGLTYPIRTDNIYNFTGQLQLTMISANRLDPDVTEYRAKATDVTVQFGYTEWNQIYTETTNYWWEEKVVYERVKNVYPHLIPYTTNPSGKDFTITYGSITESLRRLNNVTMIHESDYYGGISVNIAEGVYPTSRSLLSTNTYVDKDKIPYFIYDGLSPNEITISYHSLDTANRKINGLRFVCRRDYAFEGAIIGIASGDNIWAAPWEFNGSYWASIVEFDVPVGYTPEEWIQFVTTTNIYKYTMTASSLTFTQTDWDKFYV